ncbi:putative isomerase YbhE [Neolentinus lepideus HHB14362 ss-1]|uniref:Putative isomerase YbhE n=1 Tax=Neolentinus lepideus HHB14362 ss-1 TaxID=1314782 RepID=A0A165TTJ4_9AGAM|nr:putative isomerase YbhE [Neolentinus lepideus HHB14362 ss-1]
MSTYLVLVASYSSSIYTLEFSTSPPTLKLLSSVEVGFHPSWITPHPSDASTVFAALEDERGKVAEVKFDETGKGTLVSTCESGGHSPCTILAAGQELIVGNYMSGNVVSIPLALSSPYISPKSSLTSLQLHGSGPNTNRQRSSHPHQVYKSPTRDELLIPDLGSDKTWRLVRGQNGWEITGSIEYSPGNGPRHVIEHDECLYTVLELHNTLSQHSLGPLLSSEKPSQTTTLPTHIPVPIPSQTIPLGMLAAEILLATTPSPFLYVSNRNDPSPGGDSIAIFSLSPSGLERIGEVKTGLHHLRGMILFGQDDKYLIAGGVNGGEGGVGVKVFERIDGGMGLKETILGEPMHQVTRDTGLPKSTQAVV